ncbi:hypothetical protein BDN72DRAFT_650206 [Pluteus cervinus]|uniref:Uncharacterized protein n=1 Tax=Pluteus cervinus TaxID=181527 RepID=A0ACD3A276_9AGAR|nr:hypothetical protein BDN72DRAFT_650206 [Pluteus cervinus]
MSLRLLRRRCFRTRPRTLRLCSSVQQPRLPFATRGSRVKPQLHISSSSFLGPSRRCFHFSVSLAFPSSSASTAGRLVFYVLHPVLLVPEFI